jgi:peptidoglycan hydrolase-like protein with peptidoglycan-binding domain
MNIKGLVATVLLSGALALPGAAFAQGAGNAGGAGGGGGGATAGAQQQAGGAGGGAGGGGTAGAQQQAGGAGGGAAAGGAEAGNYATRTMPSQRIVTQNVGRGAVLTISGSGVREVQQALNRLGYAAGPITGNWDKDTARAMAEFQGAHGLEPSGNLDISSIAALGLWNRLIGNPIGNNNESVVGTNATGAPPPRGTGGGNAANAGGNGATGSPQGRG